MVESIKQNDKKISVELSQKATRTFQAKQLLKAVAQTKFSATLEPGTDKMKIVLVIQPKMENSDVLSQLQKLVQSLTEQLAIPKQKAVDK